jgi:hypothetical protein
MTLFALHVNGQSVVRLVVAASANAVIQFLSPTDRAAGYLIVAQPRTTQQ